MAGVAVPGQAPLVQSWRTAHRSPRPRVRSPATRRGVCRPPPRGCRAWLASPWMLAMGRVHAALRYNEPGAVAGTAEAQRERVGLASVYRPTAMVLVTEGDAALGTTEGVT